MKFMIWVANLESKKTRAEGRKIAKRFAVPNLRLQEVAQACKELGLNFQIENKKYPRSWWEEGGRVVVESSINKTKLMLEIASKVLEMREKRKKK
ncbi:MAG: signal recognition particle protein Srp19 [Archaeoglobaceae archaeon]|nr:signal recognition particle protein Srp19 [Archaeoglobaceae archaeon]MDW8128589.1 signal recognition particle subunit SRP19/SEC65 family protein [Archaeoglobaceae archaeon]